LRAGSNSLLLVHYDHGKGVSLNYHNCSDVHAIRDYVPIKWGDISLPLAMMRGIRWLEEEKFDFDWLITTSGQDYPVQPLHRIESFLENTSRDAFVEYELAFFARKFDDTLCPEVLDRLDEVLQSASS
jgi:hypothetical protein